MTLRLSRLSVAALSLMVLPMGAMAAQSVNVRHAQGLLNAAQNMPKASVLDMQSKQAMQAQGAALTQALGLSSQDGMSLKRQNTDPSTGDLNLHFKQTFRGLPIWGKSVIVTKTADGSVRWMHGQAIQGLSQDIRSTKPAFSADAALTRVKGMVSQGASNMPYRIARKMHSVGSKLDNVAMPSTFRNEKSELSVYLDDQGKGHLAYVVSFYTEQMGGGAPSRPVYILDAHSGQVLKHFDKLMTDLVGTGPGGNQKTGEYYYGTDYPKLDLTVSSGTYSYDNAEVRTVNLNNRTNGTTTFTNSSSDFTPAMTNGAYSPINDAHYMGGEIVSMYNDYVGTNPLSFQLVMRVHYSNNYENAFWDGNYMNFGDGASTFYPLVCFDVAGHEVSHGYTEQHSNLTYSGQSGGMNESFSDMAGEATEYHAKGSNDWMVGKDIFKGSGALRYMDDPTRDGSSIDNANDYNSSLDVHYSSGVFNKAFYLLATTSGWDTPKAFKLFAYANANYWTADATFDSAAQGVHDAASALGFSTADVDAAFAGVGIDLSGSGGGGSTGGGTTALENGTSVDNLSGAQGSDTYFTLDVPAGATNLTFNMSGGSGDADLYVQFGSQPTSSSYDCRPYKSGNNESCSFSSPQAGTYYVMIHGYQSYSGVSLVGSFDTSTGGGGGSGSCPSGYTEYTGTLSSGGTNYEPAGNYYQTSTSGTHSGILIGPSGTDFDLYLQKWNGHSSWRDVDSSTSSTSNEQIDYSGNKGYYTWKVTSYSGSGDYTFCLKHPN